MGIETLKRIKRADGEKEKKLKAAQAEAGRITARAAKTAANIIEAARRDAEAAVSSLKKQRMDEGRQGSEMVIAANDTELQKARLAAEKNMGRAVELVVKKVCG